MADDEIADKVDRGHLNVPVYYGGGLTLQAGLKKEQVEVLRVPVSLLSFT